MRRPSFKVLVFGGLFVSIAVFLLSQSAVSWHPGLGRLRVPYAVRSYVENNQQIIKEDHNDTAASSFSNLESCPSPYRGTECSIKLVGTKERGTPRHSGFLTVNQRQLYDWNNTTGIILIRIGYACELNESVKFDVDNVEGFAKYITDQTRDALLIAVSGDYNVLENRVVQTKLKSVGAWSNGVVRDCAYGYLFKIGYRGLTESWKGSRQGAFSFSKTITQGSPVVVEFTEPSYDELEKKYTEVKLGGHWRPPNCKAHSKIAIIIPFRNRHPHLRSLLNYMLPFLMKQNVDFTFYIIEQAGNTIFNRAKMMNIGYREAKQRDNYDCYIFHDVDVFPEDNCNIYVCADQPRHFIVGFSTEGYVAPYALEFGGVTGLTSAHIESINGFSNVFFAWGGEDDEIAYRVSAKEMKIRRYPREIGKYKMITHNRDKTNPSSGRRRVNMHSHARSYMSVDGLNSLHYERLSIETKPLYTHITVQIEGPSLSKDVPAFYLQATDNFKKLLQKGKPKEECLDGELCLKP